MERIKDIAKYVWNCIKCGAMYYFIMVLGIVIAFESSLTKAYNWIKRHQLNIIGYVMYGILCLLMFGCTWRQGYMAGRKSVESQYVSDTVTVTNIVHDTIRIVEPQYITKTLHHTVVDSFYLPQEDTFVFAEVPIDQLYYRQDSLYEAWISGYNPNLDSIHIYPKTIYTTERISIKENKSRWGLGVSAGYGITGPYIGIGLNYNLYTFKKR